MIDDNLKSEIKIFMEIHIFDALEDKKKHLGIYVCLLDCFPVGLALPGHNNFWTSLRIKAKFGQSEVKFYSSIELNSNDFINSKNLSS